MKPGPQHWRKQYTKDERAMRWFTVYAMRTLDNVSVAVIARRLGVTPARVHVLLEAAEKEMQRYAYELRGHDLSALGEPKQ